MYINATPSYFDYMASTPLDPHVRQKMVECLSSSTGLGNPSSQSHRYGWQATELIETARQQVADLIGADPREIVWTSGASEANNLAIKGAADFYQRKGKHIITMSSEHKSVLNTCQYLEKQGFSISYLRPQKNGLLDLAEFIAAIRPDTILASIMWVNNETGVIQDIAKIAEITRQQGIIFHVDAAQAVGRIAIDVHTLPVDLMTFSGHKLYGPKGVGSLYLRRHPRIRLTAQIHGGEQEGGLRSGTLATHQIVGMGMAWELAKHYWQQDQERATFLGKRLLAGLQSITGVDINGDLTQRIPHCLNLSFAGVEAETLLLSLSNLAVSTGSACHSALNMPSHVLVAMGLSRQRAQSSLRLSIGRFSTVAEVDLAIAEVTAKVEALRQLSPLWQL